MAIGSAEPYAICTSLQINNHASTPPLSFLQAKCPSCQHQSTAGIFLHGHFLYYFATKFYMGLDRFQQYIDRIEILSTFHARVEPIACMHSCVIINGDGVSPSSPSLSSNSISISSAGPTMKYVIVSFAPTLQFVFQSFHKATR